MTNQFHILEGISDGFITPEKLKSAARQVNMDIPDDEIERII